jgi:hypothetical protein
MRSRGMTIVLAIDISITRLESLVTRHWSFAAGWRSARPGE